MFGKTKEELAEEVMELKEELKLTQAAKRKLKKENGELTELMRSIETDNKHDIKALKLTHSLEITQKDFDSDKITAKETKKLNTEIVDLKKTNAELKMENVMLDKIVDLNAGMVDIKSLINTLIEKLPEIKINNLSLSNGDNKKSDK